MKLPRLTPRRAALGLATTLAVAVHLNSLGNGFAYDDLGVVRDNPEIRSLANAPQLFVEPYWPVLYGGEKSKLHRPVTLVSFAFDWALWDGRPFGFHLTNVLLHALATALLVVLLLRLGGAWGAAVGGALFAVHPVHVEAVANVVGRAELLAAAAVFAALAVALRAPPRPAETRPAVAVSVGLLYLLGILAKESAIVLPLLVLLVDGIRREWTGPRDLAGYARRRGRLYAALFVAALAALALRTVALGEPIGKDPAPAFLPDDSFGTRFFTMIRVWPHYLRLLVLPLELSPDYSPAVLLPAHALSPLGLLGLALGGALAGLAVLSWRRAPLAALGLFWTAVAILPVSNLLFPSGVVLAERTLYLPSAGVSFVAAALVPQAVRWPRVRRRAAAAAAALLVAGFGALTIRRNPVWNDNLTLFNLTLREHPESYKVHWALANSLAARGEWQSAVERYWSAIRIWPHDHRIWTELAGQYIQRQAWAPAADAATRAVRLAPGSPTAHHFRTLALLNGGSPRDAAAAAHEGLQEIGADALLYYLLSQAHERLGRYRLAAHAFRASAGIQEGGWLPWYHIGRLYGLAGDRRAAVAALDSAQRRAGDDPAARGAIDALRDARLRGP